MNRAQWLPSGSYKRQGLQFYAIKVWKAMTDESDNVETIQTKKLLIDNPSDFQFHAAYVAYSEAFDKATDDEVKEKLNQSILALQQNQMEYSIFYRNLSQYRGASQNNHYQRSFIKTQRKREWRRKAQKRERNKRHGN